LPAACGGALTECDAGLCVRYSRDHAQEAP
jgi:hypothetical protein